MVTRLPEVNVALFALLLNFPWEIYQDPLFDRTASAPHLGDCQALHVGDWLLSIPALVWLAGRVFYVARH